MVTKVRLIGLFIAMTSIVVFAQRNSTSSSSGVPSYDFEIKKDNAVNLNPLATVWNTIDASYEHLFGDRHGAMFQAGLYFKGGYSLAAHYRYHYFTNKSHEGLNSPFIGVFLSHEKVQDEANVDSADVTTIYTIEASYVNVGLNWGERWAVSDKLSIAFRAGYGYPFYARFTWPEPKPANVKSAEKKKKFFGGIDAELSIGYAF
jgi:hypothetical protein